MRSRVPVILAVLCAWASIAFAPGAFAQDAAPPQPIAQPAATPNRVAAPGMEEFENRPIRTGGPINRGTAPTTRAAASPGSALDLQRVVLALMIVVGLIVALRFAVRKFFPDAVAPSASRVVKVLGRTMLAPRQHVLLLQVGRRVIVVADNGGQLASLAQITEADEVAQLIGAITSKSREDAASFQAELNEHAKQADEPGDVETMRSDVAKLMETVRMIRTKNGAE